MSKSSRKTSQGKPGKPRPDFPLFPHATGRWAKKVKGKFRYFGKVSDDPEGKAALDLWLKQRDDLLAGRDPKANGEGLTVADLANRFLTTKQRLLDSRELTARTIRDYRNICARLVAAFGKDRPVVELTPDDFGQFRGTMAKTLGPVALYSEVNRARVVFRWGYEEGLLDRPMRYGTAFRRPSRKVLRETRHSRGSRMLEAEQIRQLLEIAGQPMKAMVLLGVNCGLGNGDCGNLEFGHLDLRKGWLDFPRPKTGVERRCPLWPETIAAIQEAIETRSKTKSGVNSKLVFVTKYGGSWAKEIADNPISKEFTKLLKTLKMKKTGVGFYALRRSFETIAGDSRDQVAVDHIMGHAPAASDMAAVYRERINVQRLRDVVDHVHRWLFEGKEEEKK